MNRARCCLGSWAFLALLTVAVGCGGPNLGQVSGTVTLDGEPLPDARLTFAPLEGGRPAFAQTDASGKYTLTYDRRSEGAEPGEHVVEITTGIEIEQPDGSMKLMPEQLPIRYNSETGLRATITEGDNEVNFDLESGGEVVDANEAE